MDVWLFHYDGELSLECATTDEVADCRWMAVSDIRRLYEEKKLVQTLDYFFCVMDAERPDYSHIIGRTVKGTVCVGHIRGDGKLKNFTQILKIMEYP